MIIETKKATAPRHWASLLINGDACGMDSTEEAAAAAWESSLAPWYIAGVQDGSEDFMRWHDAAAFFPLAADCVAYILHKEADQ